MGVGFRFSNTGRSKGYSLDFPGGTGQASRHLVACEEAAKQLRELDAYARQCLANRAESYGQTSTTRWIDR